MVGKLERVPLKEVWKHEALDFTKWLEENPDVLSDALGLTLQNIEREKSAGDFRVDLVGEDTSGNAVVIENQLEKSNHDHLGKLLTYLAAIEAKAAVWMVSEPRPEHVKAIAWLNDSSSASFYLVKVEAVRIGASEPAPMLTLIVGPSEASKSVEHAKKEMAERHVNRRRFWTDLIARLKERSVGLHSNLSPGTETWISTGAGKSGLGFSYVILMGDSRVELYIDRGKGGEKQNEAIFQHLLGSKDRIEKSFGENLDWQQLEGKRAFRIARLIDKGGLKDEDKWAEIQDAMIDAMARLEKAFRPHINALQI